MSDNPYEQTGTSTSCAETGTKPYQAVAAKRRIRRFSNGHFFSRRWLNGAVRTYRLGTPNRWMAHTVRMYTKCNEAVHGLLACSDLSVMSVRHWAMHSQLPSAIPPKADLRRQPQSPHAHTLNRIESVVGIRIGEFTPALHRSGGSVQRTN